MTRVLTKISPNPKRVGSGAWHRYNLYYAGATEADLLARGVEARDLKWDSSQGFITWGEGERAEPPPVPAAEPPPPAQRRASAPTVRGPSPTTVAAPEASATASAVPSVQRHLSGAVVRIECSPADRVAAWYLEPSSVEAAAREGGQDRPWRVRVYLPDGSVRFRDFPGDRIAQNQVWLVTQHGIDPDDWQLENK